MKILLTGSDGFLGQRVRTVLENRGDQVVGCDVDDDILSREWARWAEGEHFDYCIHLAAHKYATSAEEIPEEVAELNITGTANVVDVAGCPVILASTCKAADPCTVYGASKLIAERIVLNAGGTVVRLVNVLGSVGSVVPIWDAMDGPLPVTDCKRMWITPERAVRLFVQALDMRPGRYAPSDYGWATPAELARDLHPGRATVRAPLRRGDRPVERLVGEYERSEPVGTGMVRIYDQWE